MAEPQTTGEALSLDLLLRVDQALRAFAVALDALRKAQQSNHDEQVALLAKIQSTLEEQTVTFQDVKDAIAQVNTHTSTLSDHLDQVVANVNQIIADLKAGQPTPQDLADAVAALQSQAGALDTLSTHLDQIGQDPSNPLPPTPPAPAPTP